MTTIQLPANGWRPRWYQQAAWDAWENGIKRQLLIWHRRAGKDELNLHQHAVASHQRIGNYWHMLPEQAQARKAIWHAVNPVTGRRRIYDAFPREVIDGDILENEMMIRLKVGSTFQLLGSDNYDSAVGAPPIGITFSEWALANPTAWAYLSPILAENGGWASFISTPRGANHLKRMHTQFAVDPHWFVQVLSVDKTKAISLEAIEEQRLEYLALFGQEIADMLVEQEFYCSWAGASVGSILARAMDRAEQEGRINDAVAFDPDGAPAEISCDLGFRDTTVWWFWQRRIGGYRVFACLHGSGMDADDWIPELDRKLTELGIDHKRLGRIWLPHDAAPRTFQSRHTAFERFAVHYGIGKMGLVPKAKQGDKVSAARLVVTQCEFNATACAAGIDGLTAWQFEWNEDSRSFSRDPKHDWSSHFGDSFAYGAQVMRGLAPPARDRAERHLEVIEGPMDAQRAQHQITLADAWSTRRKTSQRI